MRYKIEYESRDKRQPYRVIDTESLTTKRWQVMKYKYTGTEEQLSKLGFKKDKNRFDKLIDSHDGNDFYIKVRSDKTIYLAHYSSDYRKLNDMTCFIDILFELIKQGLVEVEV